MHVSSFFIANQRKFTELVSFELDQMATSLTELVMNILYSVSQVWYAINVTIFWSGTNITVNKDGDALLIHWRYRH